MSARERILQRLRSAALGAPPALPDVQGFYAAEKPQPAPDRAARIDRFCAQLAFWRAEVLRVRRSDWAEKVRELCVSKGIASLLYGPQALHGQTLATAGILGLRPYTQPIDDWKQDLFENVDAGFTSTRGAIVDTGALIVWPDTHEPRLLSLVPPIHIALVDADHLYDTLFDALREQAWGMHLPSNALLISGPSKTADIQTTLAYGAHGPKELIVLLLVHDEALA
jgi:L-lactate dehydrogenase complex protein LldG